MNNESHANESSKMEVELEFVSTFAHFDKMQRLAIAFALAGRLVTICQYGSEHTLYVYVYAKKSE